MNQVYTAKIYGNTELLFQNMPFEMEWIRIGIKISVNYVKFLEVLQVAPNDLQTDLEENIAAILGVNPRVVWLECEVELCSIKPAPEPETLDMIDEMIKEIENGTADFSICEKARKLVFLHRNKNTVSV
jgi:hypothetical protein